ncbi:MAG: hypothetical protein JJU36_11580 [Phycisphaeraceae bacterium]|nr:hypothetical protein [Phycisphaeraceae bacterium]
MAKAASRKRASSTAPPNVYTVLLLVAFVALLAGVVTLWITNTDLTGQGNPFHIVDRTTGR